MKIKRIYALVFALLLLLSVLVSATVVISYTYPTSTTSKAPIAYLTQAENYQTANALGFIYAPESGSPSNIINDQTIYINTTAGAGTVYLLNVLKIVNNTGSKTIYPIVWINYTSSTPVYFTLYWGSSELGFNGNTNTVTNSLGSVTYSSSTTTSGAISMSGISTLYLAIQINGSATGSGTLTVQYTSA